MISAEISEITVTAASIRERKPAADDIYPEAATDDEYTGMKESIKSEHSPITFAEYVITSFIGTRNTEAEIKVITVFATVPVF